jgi:hypothetical protein
LKPLQLAPSLLLGVLRHACFLDPVGELLQFRGFDVVVAQLFLDLAQLLAKDVFALLR